jgi:hypothetical protein
MAIPGFSADASIRSGGQHYRGGPVRTNPGSGSQVSPAVLILRDGIPWMWVPGDVHSGGLDGGGGGGGGGGTPGCRCLEFQRICSPIINCVPGGGCSEIQDCRTVCARQECTV